MSKMKKSVGLALFLIFLLGFILRTLYLSEGALIFGYDQARDAFTTQQILEGDFKILGPPASTPGLYHGVFYYYFLAPAYLLGQGNPIWVAYWVAFFNASAIFIVFYLTYLLSKKYLPSFLASILFAVSFEATQYATWLSNPTLGIWTVPMIYLGLWMWIKQRKKWGAIICAVGVGLSIQSEIFLAYHILPVVFWLWVARKKISGKVFLSFIFFLFLSLSSMLLVEVKFGFQSISGIANLLSSGDTLLAGRSVGDFIVLYLKQLGRTFSNNLLPSNAGYGGALGLFFLIWIIYDWYKKKSKKNIISWQPFVATFILSHLPIVSIGGISTPFLTVGLGAGAIILVALSINKIWSVNKVFVLVLFSLLLISNLITVFANNKKGQVIFAIQKDMLLSNELKALDYIYKEAGGKPFSINTLTSPLWINTTWSYLFNWYGKSNYGYLPSWRGRDQVGQLGNNLEVAQSNVTLHFYIIEPPQGLPKFYLESEPSFEDSRSKILSEMKFGELQVQKREITK